MSISFTANAPVSGSTRTKVMDIPLQSGITIGSLCLSSQGGDPVWEMFFDKNVSDLPQPSQPSLSVTATGGNLPRSTTYYVRISAVDSNGLESPASDTLKKITTGSTTDTNKINVSISSVAGAVSYNVYVGINPSAEMLVGSTTLTTYTISDYPVDIIYPPSEPSIQISSTKSKLDSIPMSGSQITVHSRIAIWVTTSASATVYVSIIGV